VGAKAILNSGEYARLAVDVASDRQASDVVMLDIRGVSDFADYFVILTAESSRQIDSLAEEIEKALEARGAGLHHMEGTADGGWVLLDFSDVIIHLFRPEQREFYHIEGAWSRGIETVRIQ
jgi:ribosome-associated protein